MDKHKVSFREALTATSQRLFLFFKTFYLSTVWRLETPVLLFGNGIITARCRAVVLAYLPNKKILLLIVFVLLIFAGWFYFSGYKNKQIQYTADKEKSPLAVALDTTSQLDTDTDGDGLKDWEELLWKTDSGKADTDGDGTNDNEEITLNRNPLKAGPDDKISDKEDLVAQEKAVSDGKQNTLTATYAKQFLTEYLLLKQQKGELTEEDKSQLVKSFLSGLKPLKVEDKYAISDLKNSDETGKEAIKKYAEGIKKLLIDSKNTLPNESEIFNLLLKNIEEGNIKNIELSIKALNNYAILNKKRVEVMLSPAVPKNLSQNHLEVVNGFNNIIFAIENMAVAQTDPVKAMMGQKLYDEQMLRIYKALKNIQEIFNEYEITVFK